MSAVLGIIGFWVCMMGFAILDEARKPADHFGGWAWLAVGAGILFYAVTR